MRSPQTHSPRKASERNCQPLDYRPDLAVALAARRSRSGFLHLPRRARRAAAALVILIGCFTVGYTKEQTPAEAGPEMIMKFNSTPSALRTWS